MSGPPRKKRRSKWDIQPDDLSSTPAAPANWEETTPTQGPTSTVAAIAAKLNAKLASEGKLKPASAVYMPPSCSLLSLPPTPLVAPPTPGNPAPSATPMLMTLGSSSSTIEINNLDVQDQLMKPATIRDINKTTGVMVAVRGKYITAEEMSRGISVAPLHLHIQGPSKEKVDATVNYINSLIRSLQQSKGKEGVPLLATPPIPPLLTTQGPHYLQDKVFVGLDKAPEEFRARQRTEGVGGSFLGHITSRTGAKVYMRGRGSGFLEPTSGRESFEAMYIYISHSNQEGLTAARKLCESLIETVQKDFETWKRSQQPLGFGGQPSQYHPQFTNPYQRATYPQPHFGPMAPSGDPNFGPPPPGGYPPPPPGFGFYPGAPPPGPYGAPPPGGFAPPPPGEFHPPGPPYSEMLPHQIPLPPGLPPPNPGPSHITTNEKPEGSTSDVAVAPQKRRFTETVKGANGVTTSDDGPYWAKLQEPIEPRRFTEGPPPNQNSTESEPLSTDKDQTAPPETNNAPTDPPTLKEGTDSATQGGDSVEESSKLPPPPPPPPPPPAADDVCVENSQSTPSMPPPSFLPPRALPTTAAATAPSTAGLPKPAIESATPVTTLPPPNSHPPSTDPAPSLATPKAPPPASAGPLVAYGEDSDSDADS